MKMHASSAYMSLKCLKAAHAQTWQRCNKVLFITAARLFAGTFEEQNRTFVVYCFELPGIHNKVVTSSLPFLFLYPPSALDFSFLLHTSTFKTFVHNCLSFVFTLCMFIFVGRETPFVSFININSLEG